MKSEDGIATRHAKSAVVGIHLIGHATEQNALLAVKPTLFPPEVTLIANTLNPSLKKIFWV